MPVLRRGMCSSSGWRWALSLVYLTGGGRLCGGRREATGSPILFVRGIQTRQGLQRTGAASAEPYIF